MKAYKTTITQVQPHPPEGICITLLDDDENVVGRTLKHKWFVFCALEGIARNDAGYVDTEEVA